MEMLFWPLCLVLWAALAAVITYCIRQVPIAVKEAGDEEQAEEMRPTAKLKVAAYFLLFLFSITFGVFALMPPGVHVAARLSIVPAVVLLMMGGLYLWYRRATRVYRLLQSDDPHQALMAIRDEIDVRGATMDRLQAIGVAHMTLKQWPQALSAFEQAEQMGTMDAISKSNQALALWRSGRMDEALALYRKLRADAPDQPIIASNLCQLLVELDQWDEAREQLQAAEKLVEKSGPMSAKDRETWQGILDDCRAKLNVDSDRESSG